MKHSKRILAYSALALIVMLAAFGAIASDTSNVALAQETATVPVAPVLTAQASGATTINLAWNAVDDAASYELWAWDNVNQWQRLDGGTADPLTAITFAHTGLTSGRTYYYQVRAVTGDDRTGAWSERVNEVAGDAPARPVLTLSPGYLQITVSWPAVTGAVSYELWAWDGAWAQLPSTGTAVTGTEYVHTGLTAGRTIYYQARAANAGGTMSAWSAQVNATVLSAPTLSAPQSLNAASGDEQVTLTWTAPATGAATGYHYRHVESGGTQGNWMDAGNVLTMTVTGLTNGQGYDFEVRGYNSQGNGPAATASASPMGAPEMPVSLAAAPTETTVVLTWTAPDDNGAAITHYEHIHYASGGTAPTTWTNAGSVLTVTISNLTKGTAYMFMVRAVNSVGESEAASVSATPSGKPGPVRNLTAAPGAGSIMLDWDEPADDGGSAIVSYEVQKYNATTTNWGAAYSGSDTSYTDRSAIVGATTEYRVRAINANANDPSDWSTVSGIAQAQAVPGEPKNLKASRGDGSITYTWEAPDDIGGTPITKYEYRHYLTTTPIADIPDWTSASLRTGAAFPNLDSAQTYEFDVRAVNAVGPGPAESLDATPAATKPSLPRRFTAQADNSDAEIELDWDNPIEDGGSAVTGYNLQVKDADGEWGDITGWAVTDTTTTEGLDITADLTFGVTYEYRIRAFNAHNDDSPTAYPDADKVWAEASATVASSHPARVGALDGTDDDVSAEFDDGRIKVTWTKPADHGEPITSYRLRWLSGTETEFQAANVVSVQAPATEYIMVGPAVATGYAFQVLAVNSLTDFEDVDNSADDSGAAPKISWSASSTPIPVPAVAVQATSGTDTLAATVGDDGSATITWRRVADPNYTIASYDLQWLVVTTTTTVAEDADDSTAGDAWDGDDVMSENLAAQGLMSRITDPLPGAMNLYVRVRVVTNVGTKSNWAQVGPVSVAARDPDHPVLTATIIGQNVLLSWTTPMTNGAALTGYELQFKKDDGNFGDHDGDDDNSGADGADDPDNPDNDVFLIGATATSYSHEDLAADSTYTYRIRTVTSENTVDYSNTDAAALATALAGRKWSAEVMAQSDPGPPEDPVVPSTPTLTVTPDNTDGHIRLKWTKPAEGTSPITSYHLQRWNGSMWEALPASLGAQDEEYNDETAELGRMYYYAIRAASASGMGEWTQSNFPSGMLNAKAPAKIDLSLTVDKQAIMLSWMAPESNGDDVVAYQIQFTTTGPVAADGTTVVADADRDWGDGTTENNTLSPTPALATTYTHSGLTPGRTYYYRIRAVNACNNDLATDTAICGAGDAVVAVADATDWSDQEDETTAPIAPSAPGANTTEFGGSDLDDLAATGGNTQVMLTWALPGPDSDFTNDQHLGTGGAHITSVEIQRWNGSTGMWDDIKTVDVAYVDDEADPLVYTSASQSYTDTGLADGMTYTYRVRAVNSAGASGWSNQVSAATNAARPDLPTLRAKVSGQSVTLTWNTPDNNGSTIQRYEIQRYPSIGTDAGTIGEIDADDVVNDWGDDSLGTGGTDQDVIVPMPAGVTEHVDRALMPSTLYYYRMRAVNGCNDTDAADTECPSDAAVQVSDATVAWSAVVQVTTDPKAPGRIPKNTATGTDPINGLKLTGGENKVTLEWTEPEDYDSPITEYQIDRWNSVTRMWDAAKRELPASVRMYEDTGLEAGTRYFYRVRAVNAGGEGMWSTLAAAMTDE